MFLRSSTEMQMGENRGRIFMSSMTQTVTGGGHMTFFSWGKSVPRSNLLSKFIKMETLADKNTYLSVAAVLLCILCRGYLIHDNIIMINYTITTTSVTAVIHFGLVWLGSASGTENRSPPPSSRWHHKETIAIKTSKASYGKSLLLVTETSRDESKLQLPGGAVSTESRIHQSRSWKIPLPSHP